MLSEYFISLTRITQQVVDEEGIDFQSALKEFQVWRAGDSAYSFGNDKDVLKENCKLLDVPHDTFEEFHDIRPIFEREGVQTAQLHSGTIVTAFGKKPREGAHNALNDARSIFDALCLLSEYRMTLLESL